MKHALLSFFLICSLPAMGMCSENKSLPTQSLAREAKATPQPDLTHELSNTLSNFSGNMRYEKCRELLQAGADPDGNHYSEPFLLCAAHWNDVGLAKILLEHQANVRIRNYKNATALHYATRHEKGAPLCQILLTYGADINAKNADGNTALQLALSRSYHSDVIKCLLDNGAHVNDLLNFCKDIPPCAFNYTAIITHYRFYPTRTPQKLKESQERILCFLLCLKKEYPRFPRDLKRLILFSYLRDDTLNCPLPICKPFVSEMAPQIVAKLFGQDAAIQILKAHKSEQLTPLLIEAGQRNPADGYFQSVVTRGSERFDSKIEEVITRDMLNQEKK